MRRWDTVWTLSPGFEYYLCHWLALGPWIVDNFLSATYLICKTSRRSLGCGWYSALMCSEL